MAVAELRRFTTTLKNWVGKDRKKKANLCNVVGTKFSDAGINQAFRNNELYDTLRSKTGYTTSSYLHNVIHAGKQRSKGRLETHIALYYLAMIDDDYRAYVPDIEARLFREGKTFFDVFEWCPAHYQAVQLKPQIEHNPIELSSGPQLRLRPPGVHSHPSHFSNRAIKDIIGREGEQETLRRFASLDPGFRWLQLAGAGGQGKSRMAYDLMEEVKREGWEAGFLSKADLDEFQGKAGDYRPDSWRSWNPSKPHLIIIDYVIGRESDIGFAMDQMADRSGEFVVAVRVLLVERQRWDRGSLKSHSTEGQDNGGQLYARDGKAEWFSRLNGGSELGGRWRNDLASEGLRLGSGVIELESLTSNDLVAVVRQTVPEGCEINLSDDFIKEALYRIDKSGRPLFAYFLSQALVDGKFRPAWDQPSLLEHAFDETCRKRWRRGDNRRDEESWGPCPTLSSDHPALRLALLATLVRFIDCRLLIFAQDWDAIDDHTLRQALALTDGPAGGTGVGLGNIIPALEPDILGEWFVLTAFESNGLLEQIVDTAWRIAPYQMASFLHRALQDFHEHKTLRTMLSLRPPTPESTHAYIEVALERLQHPFVSGLFSSCQLIYCLEYGAINGNIKAMNALEYINGDGLDVERSEEKAIYWANEALKHGDHSARARLGKFAYDFNEDQP